MNDKLTQDNELLANIKGHLGELSDLLEHMDSHWVYEDLVYRYYHMSFKVYRIQAETEKIVAALRLIAPAETRFCSFFDEIYRAGASGQKWEPAHNHQWTAHTRPFVEAFFHAHYFLQMAVKYGRELETAPQFMPSGWAALLSLYDIR